MNNNLEKPLHRDPVRVLYLVEGNVDIRLLLGLSEVCELTVVIPTSAYSGTDLKDRVVKSGATFNLVEVKGGRARFQFNSFLEVMAIAKYHDIIFGQELMRGALNCNFAGRLSRIPTINSCNIANIEYFRCRRKRKQIGLLKALFGETIIRLLLKLNGKLATRVLSTGHYLQKISSKYTNKSHEVIAYGIDVDYFRPATINKETLRKKLGLPADKFIVFFSSRVNHEKDPDTVIKAIAQLKKSGMDVIALNLSGNYSEFKNLANKLNLPWISECIIAKPPAHPMNELAQYYQASDVVVQASLAEGLGLSPLEALACGTPAVVTEVGGLANHLRPYVSYCQPQDVHEMAEKIRWVQKNSDLAQKQALRGRQYVIDHWSRTRAFSLFQKHFRELANSRRASEANKKAA